MNKLLVVMITRSKSKMHFRYYTTI